MLQQTSVMAFETTQAMLDVVKRHLAVLDINGNILAVNQAWRNFAKNNGTDVAKVSEGINYLDVCDRSATDGDEYAKQFAVGLRAVLANQIKSFSLEYPCHAPDKQRWFNGQVERINQEHQTLFVVSHEDITDRALAETLYQSSEQLNQLVLNSISDAVFLTDDKGQLKFVCPNIATIFGYSHREAMAYGNIQVILGNVPFNLDDLSKIGEIDNIFHCATDKYGEEHLLLINVKRVSIDQGTLLFTCRDITKHQETSNKLRESEERYLSLFERSQDAVYIHDLAGRFIDANPAGLDMLGCTREEITDITFSDLLNPEEQIKAFEQLESLCTTGAQDSLVTYTLNTKSGEQILVETMSVVIYKDAEPWAVQGIARDITEQVRLQVLEHEQRLLAEALHKTSTALLSNTLNIRVLLPQLLNDVKQVIPSNAATIMFVEGDVARVTHCVRHDTEVAAIIKNTELDIHTTRNLQEMATTKKPVLIADTYDYEGWNFSVAPFDNHIRSCIGAPIYVNHRLIGFIILDSFMPDAFTPQHLSRLQTFADQTALGLHNARLYAEIRNHNKKLEKRVECRTAQLEQEKEKLQIVLDSTDDALVIINQHGQIRQYNPAFEQAFVMGDEINENLVDYLPFEQQGKLQEQIDNAINSQKAQQLTFEVEVFDNAFFFDMVLSYMPNKNSDDIELICSLRDITALKAAEEQLRLALKQEQELNEVRTAFTSMISHEFRTPLAVISSSVSLLQGYFDRLSSEKRNIKLEQISKQVTRLTNLMDDVLMVSRADAKGLTFEPQASHLVELCHSIIEEIRVSHDKDIAIDFVPHDADGMFLLDEDLFRHIFQNLLSNAIKYSNEGSTVSARIRFNGEQLTLVVADTGIGIPKQYQDELFKTFHRAGNVGTVPGTGLGLAIVKRAVDAHRGSIQFNSVENEGTMFCVKLPTSLIESCLLEEKDMYKH